MQILVLGGSGLIGTAFAREMLAGGHSVVVLSRRPETARLPQGVQVRGWDGHSADHWMDLVESSSAVVNLVGESIGSGRWTAERKDRIVESRLQAGRILSDAIGRSSSPPQVLMQASAVGYYGPQREAVQTEISPPGSDFMAQLTIQWEESTWGVESRGIRRVIVRSGLVLDPHEGILTRFLLPTRLFAGGPMGTGRQGISWIHILDQARAMRFLLERETSRGVYNLVSPNPVSNAEFGRALAKAVGRPYWIPVPGFALRLILGEMSTLVLDGQFVRPARLVEAGFSFSFPELLGAFQNLLS
jgi:uncharacterized protein